MSFLLHFQWYSIAYPFLHEVWQPVHYFVHLDSLVYPGKVCWLSKLRLLQSQGQPCKIESQKLIYQIDVIQLKFYQKQALPNLCISHSSFNSDLHSFRQLANFPFCTWTEHHFKYLHFLSARFYYSLIAG